ncbi:SDR family oxidoreductase [Sphingobium sp. BYY-5]|uniref:SDR family oxidoreductase n=1 Tax=Sphingobium sp. BYY-5 TaxID=2926400 RepID=UPI001FA7321C|nr:SDR family oxidoreductase [Sphingobium sp. BYY-5]MCI4592182.1 SDR family oxidoreductase [Sphingobium sp. BYY-5]
MTPWTSADIPPQHGRCAVVTGTGGLGFETALALASAGAEVIVAGRNPAKGAEAVDKIRAAASAANIRFELLDLASLASVADFAARLWDQRVSLDILVNNAGIMRPPTWQPTTDGFELQLGTNYLGHYALTGLLMPLLMKGRKARVVTLSSVAARQGQINLDDINAESRYDPMPVYCQSKLACLMFAFELERRSVASGWGVASMAAHPGVSRTDLLHNAPGRRSAIGITRSLLWFLFQPAAQGALPTLFAATAPQAKGGGSYGPDGLAEIRGYPAPSKIPAQALDQTVATRLWEISEELTGNPFANTTAPST